MDHLIGSNNVPCWYEWVVSLWSDAGSLAQTSVVIRIERETIMGEGNPTPEVFEYCVVGSGAAALGFLSGVQSVGVNGSGLGDIALVTSDVGDRLQNPLPDTRFPRGSGTQSARLRRGKKLYFGDDFMYRENPHWKTNIGSYGHVPSFSFGGHTRVWGGTANLWSEEELNALAGEFPFVEIDKATLNSIFFATEVSAEPDTSPSVSTLRVSKSLAPLLRNREDKDSCWSFVPARLAVRVGVNHQGICVQCGSCLDGCPTNAIWSADEAIRPVLSKLGLVAVGLVVAVELRDDHVEIRYRTNNGVERQIRAKKCVLAAGSPSSTKLFCDLKSARRASGDDTPIQFRVAFSLRRGRHRSHNLAHIVGTSRFGCAQFYPPNGQVWERMIPKRILEFPAIQPILDRLVPIITYGNSVTDCVTYRENRFTTGRPKKNLRLHASLGFAILRRGLFLVPLFAQKGKFGESYHSGAFFKEFRDPNGFVSHRSRVFVADASGLSFIRPGSITPTVLFNAIRLGRYLESQR
jgi:ferredoxin